MEQSTESKLTVFFDDPFWVGVFAVHSVINKFTGVLVFILPFTIQIINIKYSAPLVCIVATVAAIMESRTVITDFREETK